MSRSYQTELTTACMIVDERTGNVLVQERTNGDWTGMCFPGGHVEDFESYTECVIREVREETGLEIVRPRLEGIVHWEERYTHERTVIAFFRTETFTGVLKPCCNEAVNRWVPLASLRRQPLTDWFAEQYAVFEDSALQEMYYEFWKDGHTPPRYYRADRLVPLPAEAPRVSVSVCSKITVDQLLAEGRFPKDTAVVSFYDPIESRETGYGPIDFGAQAARVIYACLPDIRFDRLAERGYTFDTYFTEAPAVARFISEAVRDGLSIMCQCDWGMGRSAACCAAILEHYERRGLSVFTDFRYSPNQMVYEKLMNELKKLNG